MDLEDKQLKIDEAEDEASACAEDKEDLNRRLAETNGLLKTKSGIITAQNSKMDAIRDGLNLSSVYIQHLQTDNRLLLQDELYDIYTYILYIYVCTLHL